MIDTMMAEMENRFRADLNGWLEYESKYTGSYAKEKIYDTFEQTMKYYHQTERAQEALHNVIFQALTKQKDFETDFDVPRFEKGLTDRHYIDLVNGYQLYTFTKRELWKMDVEPALDFFFKLNQEKHEPVFTLIKIFIPLSLDLEEDDKYEACMDRWLKQISSFTMSESLANTLLEEFYDCIVTAFETYDYHLHRSVHIRLQRLFDSLFKLARNSPPMCNKETLYAVVELAKEKGFHEIGDIERLYNFDNSDSSEIYFSAYEVQEYLISNKPIGMQKTLREYLELCERDQDDNDHEHTFKVISEYVCLGAMPNQHDDSSFVSSDESPGFDRLEQMIKQKYGGRTMAGAKSKCIYIIRTRGMFWKSILKVVTQFLDLWISEFQDAKCMDIFAKLLVQENMMPVLYQHIMKHVQHYNLMDNSTSMEMIKNISLLMETCLNHMKTNQELSLFRDHVFNFRDENDDIRSPILGSTSFWNIPFDQEIVRVTNQITSFEQDIQIPEEITRKLIILSIIWPYEVVRQLFLSCIQNKNQYIATVPVLHDLGNLCILREIYQEQQTLLVLVLNDTISPHNSELVETYMGNITQFIKSCCRHKDFSQDFPLILTPNSLVDQTLLCLNDVLNHCILQNLTSFFQNNTPSHVVLLQFALYMLNSLCESSSVQDWTTSIMSKSDLPAFLYCSPETHLVSLTKILSLRSLHNDEPLLLRLQDWESALNCINHFSVIIRYAIQTNIEKFPLLSKFFNETLQTFDWKSQLLWYNITRDMTKQSLRVPRCFFRITGALDDLFVCDKDDGVIQGSEGWYEVFAACKLSTRLTTELYEHADQWMYNLLLLWKHPYEDTIVQASLAHVLHPKTSLSVSIEYPNLLVHFLEKLYDSYTGIHEVIRNYNGYEQQDMIPIIQDLSENGTKQYFIILYIVLLLKDNIMKSEARDDKQNNYYVSSLIKVIQGMMNWGDFSQKPTSYIKLKLKMSTNIIPNNVNQQDTTETMAPTEPKIVYYPPLDTAELISQRALSIITFYHLCSLFKENKIDETQQQALERLILLIMEGFIDMSSRQNFQKMLKQQPKSRITNWKKKKSDTKFVMLMRPAVTSAEEKLLRSVIVEALPNSGRILQALDLSHKEQETRTTKPQYLYFHN